jgi:hypothetical protein
MRLSDGETHVVRHPENIAIGKTRLAIVYPEMDRFVHLSLIHVNSIETLRAA